MISFCIIWSLRNCFYWFEIIRASGDIMKLHSKALTLYISCGILRSMIAQLTGEVKSLRFTETTVIVKFLVLTQCRKISRQRVRSIKGTTHWVYRVSKGLVVAYTITHLPYVHGLPSNETRVLVGYYQDTLYGGLYCARFFDLSS